MISVQETKQRGFEKVSYEQFAKDIKDEFYLEGEVVEDMYNSITIPKRGSKHSAGYDFVSPITFDLKPNEEIKVPLGIKIYMAEDEYIGIYPRSSLGFKYHLKLANTIAVGDSDYHNNKNNEGHYWVKMRNESGNILEVRQGDSICQGIFSKYLLSDGDNFEDGNERVGGIGSTNTVKNI